MAKISNLKISIFSLKNLFFFVQISSDMKRGLQKASIFYFPQKYKNSISGLISASTEGRCIKILDIQDGNWKI